MSGEIARTHASFGTTSWTDVRQAASGESWESLLCGYRDPIYAFFRRSGWGEADAEDLTQGFVAREIEKRSVVRHADAERGRFRSYLKSALRNYSRDELRARHGRSGSRHEVSFEGVGDREQPNAGGDEFDRRWAAATVGRALERTRVACKADGQCLHLELFEARVVGPSVGGAEPRSVEAMAREHGLEASQISSMIFTVKRKFRRAMEEVVLETIDDPGELEEELGAIEAALGG